MSAISPCCRLPFAIFVRHTGLFFCECSWTPKHRSFYLTLIYPKVSDTTEWEKDIAKENMKRKCWWGHLNSSEDILHHLPQHSTTLHLICFACLCTSGKSSGLLKNKWYNWNAFGNFPNSWHGYLDIALSFYTPTCLLHWVNSFGSTNLQNIWIQVSVTFSIGIMKIIHTTIWICAIFCPFCLCGVV